MDTSEMDTNDGAVGRDAESLVPVTPAVFHILLALADGSCHGYGIMLEVARLTGGRVRVGPGTLYRSIQRMLADGLIEELSGSGGEGSDDERRRVYGVTPLGRRVAEAEARRLAALVDAAAARGLLRQSARGRGARDRSRRAV